ncbi:MULTISPECIES: hypothetical protein [Bartonella]|nr:MULTISPECIES: hypothetical protein [Bartonella]MBH9995121.1 hypothetical protein [Bartonella sp. P0291]MBH9996534.1 hypothetical protein [Bartonella sp. M0192]MBI0009985.1 hypothetical protein [Bartonella sp. M0176]MBI0012894.1 hypothetical protein [Bartonella apihabitans]
MSKVITPINLTVDKLVRYKTLPDWGKRTSLHAIDKSCSGESTIILYA